MDVALAELVWEGPILAGRTTVGRATIAVLGINLDHPAAASRAAHRGGRLSTWSSMN